MPRKHGNMIIIRAPPMEIYREWKNRNTEAYPTQKKNTKRTTGHYI